MSAIEFIYLVIQSVLMILGTIAGGLLVGIGIGLVYQWYRKRQVSK